MTINRVHNLKNNTFDKEQNLLFVLMLVSYGFKYVYIIFKV